MKFINVRNCKYMVQWHKGQRGKQQYTDGRFLYFAWTNTILTLSRFLLKMQIANSRVPLKCFQRGRPKMST